MNMRSLSAVAASLPLLMVLSCRESITRDEDGSGIIRTDGTAVRLVTDGDQTAMALLIRNASSDTLFIGRCGAEADLILERETALGWRADSANFCSFVAAPPIAISPGTQRIQVRIPFSRNDGAGMQYRVVVAVYSRRDAAYRGIRESLIALKLRRSNTFTVERTSNAGR